MARGRARDVPRRRAPRRSVRGPRPRARRRVRRGAARDRRLRADAGRRRARPGAVRLLRSRDNGVERRRRHVCVSRRLRMVRRGGRVRHAAVRDDALRRRAADARHRGRRARRGPARSSASTASPSTHRSSRRGICFTGSAGWAAIGRIWMCCIPRARSGARSPNGHGSLRRGRASARPLATPDLESCSLGALEQQQSWRAAARRRGRLRNPRALLSVRAERRRAAARAGPRAQSPGSAVAGGPHGAAAPARPRRIRGVTRSARGVRAGAHLRARGARGARARGVRHARHGPRAGGATAGEALRALAYLARRARRFAEAAGYWQQLLALRGCPPPLAREANEALAIHHEHRVRDLAEAKRFALRSLESGMPARTGRGGASSTGENREEDAK